MLGEIDDLDVAAISDLIAGDEAVAFQLSEKIGHFAIVMREDLRLQPLRSILETPFSIGMEPETGE